jgi:glutamine amidotransferase
MGWNDVQPLAFDSLFSNINAPRYYFLHSYCVVPRCSDNVLATAHYGESFTAAVRKNHIFGTQFHPEKSHQWGIDLLRNFADM